MCVISFNVTFVTVIGLKVCRQWLWYADRRSSIAIEEDRDLANCEGRGPSNDRRVAERLLAEDGLEGDLIEGLVLMIEGLTGIIRSLMT